MLNDAAYSVLYLDIGTLCLSHTGSAEHQLGDFKMIIAELVLGAPNGNFKVKYYRCVCPAVFQWLNFQKGKRQSLAFGRALGHNPRMFVLDESFIGVT